ncbi:MAG: chromate efflux transporter [Oligoflexia bacterium]|nr:chromate efflux transporter [Oligoflexia bacterium]
MTKSSPPMKELVLVFLRLGFTAFGGPAAHIALMENEFVRRLKWLTHEEFLDLLGASSLIPGPSSSELAIFIGYRHAGWRGLLLAGICFILPAALMVGGLGWLYVHYQSLPAIGKVLYGIKPVIIAVIVQAVWGLAKTAVKSRFLAALGACSVFLAAKGLSIPLLLIGAGLVSAVLQFRPKVRVVALAGLPAVALFPGRAFAAVFANIPVTLDRIFLFFLKIGSIQFGSGYVLLAFLREDLVERYRWLSEGQLLDAVAVGQFTPGPVFTTATFIGYLLHGVSGAIVATVGIFLPAFLLVAASGTYIPRLRKSKAAGFFLDGVNVASLAAMGYVSFVLAKAAIIDWATLGLAIAAFIALVRFRINSAWLVLIGAAVGMISS